MAGFFFRVKHWLQSRVRPKQSEVGTSVSAIENPDNVAAYHVVPYDESLLERARLQWHMGDWNSLIQIERDTLTHHPDRAKLALLVAAGMMQTDRAANAATYVQLAKEWGCSNTLIAQILIAGVHNTLGRAAILMKDESQAEQHFRLAVASGSPGLDGKIIARTRAMLECERLGVTANTLPSLAQEPQVEKVIK